MNRILAAAALALMLATPAYADTAAQGLQCDFVAIVYNTTSTKELKRMTFQNIFEFTADGKVFGFAKSADGKQLTGLDTNLYPYTATTTPGHYVYTTTYLAHGVRQFNIDRATGVMTGHELNPDAPIDVYFEGKCVAVVLPEPKL